MIDYLGSALVLLLVVLVPTFFGALSPTSMPTGDAAAFTTADATAAAATTLDQQLQHQALPPAHALAIGPAWWHADVTKPNACDDDFGVPSTTVAADIACEPARLL